MMKKLFSFSRYFSFSLDFLVMHRNGMIKIGVHTLPNISRSKGNQTMKFGQLIEYNMRNIFEHKKWYKIEHISGTMV